MSSPALPLTIALGAVAADGAGHHRLAFYLVLIAIPAAAGAALAAAGDLAEGKAVALRILCTTAALVLLVTSSAARANAAQGASVPAIAVSALLASLLAYGALGVAWLTAPLWERPSTPASRAPSRARVAEPPAESRAA
jgi:hypothetical protein